MNVKLISYSQSVDFVNYGITNQQEEDITAQDVLGFEQDSFSDGAYRVHYECLTVDEKEIYDKEIA